MLNILILAILSNTISPPASDGLPAPKTTALRQSTATRCKCPCGSDICRCADMGGCKLKKTEAVKSGPVTRQAVYRTENRRVCTGGRCYFTPMQVFDHWEEVTEQNLTSPALATDGAAHTPLAEVNRVLNLLPKPEIAFVDFGCGYDARWCVAAAEKWQCRVVGIEIDPERAAAAKEHVRHNGLENLITIIEGDALTTEVRGDVAVVYLYPDVLTRLKTRLEKFNAVASYLHSVPGLPMQQNGDTFIYRRTAAMSSPVQQQHTRRAAVWGGMVYSGPVCNSPRCQMCAAIRAQLGH